MFMIRDAFYKVCHGFVGGDVIAIVRTRYNSVPSLWWVKKYIGVFFFSAEYLGAPCRRP